MKQALDTHNLQDIIEDVIVLAKREASGNPPKISLSNDTAVLLGIAALPSEDSANLSTDAGEKKKTEASADAAQTVDTGKDAVDNLSDGAPPLRSAKEEPVEQSVAAALDSGEIPSAVSPSSISESLEDSLEIIAEEAALCEKCPLGATRNKAVPGEGNACASLVFVGEAPGADEDRTGRPFVGRAGKLLTDIIVKGMEMKREDVFICNVLKCRPPENRTPTPEEVAQCEPYLLRQIAVIRPKVICALGATAAQTLLKTTAPIKQLRGVWHNYHGIPFRVTYHPAYLLRSPGEKRKTWEDVQEVMRVLSGEVTPEI